MNEIHMWYPFFLLCVLRLTNQQGLSSYYYNMQPPMGGFMPPPAPAPPPPPMPMMNPMMTGMANGMFGYAFRTSLPGVDTEDEKKKSHCGSKSCTKCHGGSDAFGPAIDLNNAMVIAYPLVVPAATYVDVKVTGKFNDSESGSSTPPTTVNPKNYERTHEHYHSHEHNYPDNNYYPDHSKEHYHSHERYPDYRTTESPYSIENGPPTDVSPANKPTLNIRLLTTPTTIQTTTTSVSTTPAPTAKRLQESQKAKTSYFREGVGDVLQWLVKEESELEEKAMRLQQREEELQRRETALSEQVAYEDISVPKTMAVKMMSEFHKPPQYYPTRDVDKSIYRVALVDKLARAKASRQQRILGNMRIGNTSRFLY